MDTNKDNPVAPIDEITKIIESYEKGGMTHLHALYLIGRVIKNQSAVETYKEVPIKSAAEIMRDWNMKE